MVATEIVKSYYFSYQSNSCKEDEIFYDEIFHQKHESYTFELPLIKLSWPVLHQKNVATSTF